MGVKVDNRAVLKAFDKLKDLPQDAMKEAYPFLKQKTPIKGGNARSKTKLNKLTIKSGYGYAGRLDEGWSKQAPRGITDPTISELDNIVDELIRDL